MVSVHRLKVRFSAALRKSSNQPSVVTSWMAEERLLRLSPEPEEVREPFRSPPEREGVSVPDMVCVWFGRVWLFAFGNPNRLTGGGL